MAGRVTKASLNNVSTHPLQSWEWGEFRSKWGNELLRLPFGQLVINRIPKTGLGVGTFIKGPKPTAKILTELRKVAEQKKLIFIKLEPNSTKDASSIKILKTAGAKPGKTLFTPTTFWIDLTPTEDELMKSFTSKTRYNIRLAQKKEVEVVEDNSDKAFEKYLKLTRETVKRQGFYAHTEAYHRLMWRHLNENLKAKNEKPIARLLTAKYKGEIITTWIVFVWKDFLYYPYGASSSNPKHKNLMANNLMMWEAIRYGKSLGLSTFDLWGREPGKGFTKFKEGYNPKVVEFVGTWDLSTSPLYWPYRAAETIRWRVLRAKTKFSKPSF